MLANRVLFLSCAVLLNLSGGESKVIRGVASSLEAWKQKGQFIAKFCFHGEPEGLLATFNEFSLSNRQASQVQVQYQCIQSREAVFLPGRNMELCICRTGLHQENSNGKIQQ